MTVRQMADLFDSDTPERIDLPGGDVRLLRAFLEPSQADQYLAAFLSETDWKQSKVFVWGKWHLQPRLIAWHGDSGTTYTYSGSKMIPLPWTPTLAKLRASVENASNAKFNSVLLNLYRDQNDRMGWHSDDEKELGPRPTIASLSLGDTRDFLFKSKHEKKSCTHKVPLTHGSLLIMSGDTQSNWLHAINRESKPASKRINLTFRLIHSPASS